MSFLDYLVTDNLPHPFIDGMVLFELSDDVYREYARHGLFTVDHHGALRFEPTAQIIATSREQFDILISELERVRDKTDPRGREPKPEHLHELVPEGGYGERAWPPVNVA